MGKHILSFDHNKRFWQRVYMLLGQNVRKLKNTTLIYCRRKPAFVKYDIDILPIKYTHRNPSQYHGNNSFDNHHSIKIVLLTIYLIMSNKLVFIKKR